MVSMMVTSSLDRLHFAMNFVQCSMSRFQWFSGQGTDSPRHFYYVQGAMFRLQVSKTEDWNLGEQTLGLQPGSFSRLFLREA